MAKYQEPYPKNDPVEQPKKQNSKMDKPEPIQPNSFVPGQIGNGGKPTEGIVQNWRDSFDIEPRGDW